MDARRSNPWSPAVYTPIRPSPALILAAGGVVASASNARK